jgi:DNA invertase Pin-like site-specific DNA recombinase
LVVVRLDRLARSKRKLIRARCDEGIKRAKARGTVFGRKPVLDAGEKSKIGERYGQGETIAELARDYNVGVATIHRTLHGTD